LNFLQRTYTGEKEERRATEFYIESKQAVQAFNSEDMLNQNKDQLTILAWNGSEGVEMNMRQIRTAIRYLNIINMGDAANDDVEIRKAA